MNAWLCYPNCDANDLYWDYNSDDQINFLDWVAADMNDFAGAFKTNGRYVLTDFRGSVIGMTDANDNLIEISYNAWGSPSYVGSLDGLNILWNGYYYDDETDNYYLRNRYYSPLERKFITDDPHGINPDGNWNNSPNILGQYNDGYSLTSYCLHDPINNNDEWGLWRYALPPAERSREERTFVVANNVNEWLYNMKTLAQLVKLNESEFDKWGKRALERVDGIQKCGAWVSNTAYIDIGSYGWGFLGWYLIAQKNSLSNQWESSGNHVVYSGKWVTSKQIILSNLGSEDIYKYAYIGHGYDDGSMAGLLNEDHRDVGRYWDISPGKYTLYGISEMHIISCWSSNGRTGWETNISDTGYLRTVNGKLTIFNREYENE